MKNQYFNKFFSSIIATSILAMALFIISFFAIIIPQFEKNMMDRKKEMIKELTNAAISIIDEHNTAYTKHEISLEQAKINAARQIEQMRYGTEAKDYFWIIDNTPVMVMHPYRKELNGKSLAQFKDSHEKKLFVAATELVRTSNEGFIDYYWQWKDDTTRVVPKLSYVKGYAEWQWIVGTGIYLDDVESEIRDLKARLRTISGIIVGIIIIALIYIIRQSYKIEKKRKQAEDKLLQSNKKYKTLVEASTEGTLMFIEQKVTFCNLKFANMTGLTLESITGTKFDDFFGIQWNEMVKMFSEPQKTITLETALKCADGLQKEVIISVSRIKYPNHEAYILAAKDVSRPKLMERSAKKLSEDLYQSLQLMNQAIKPFIKNMLQCDSGSSIQQAAKLMKKHNSKVLFVSKAEEIIGVINDTDLKNKVLAEGLETDMPVSSIMSGPVISIKENALLYEAIILFKRHRVSHLLVKGANNQPLGVISNQDALELQRNSLNYLMKEINASQNIIELKNIHQGIPVLVQGILTGSDNTPQTLRTLTRLTDSITHRVINLAIEEIVAPPCEFAFIVMGSEGRMEQTLKTDQDNAFILSDHASKADVDYFLRLANKININLDEVGYNLCKGNIMARNKKWCQPLSSWKQMFAHWTNEPEPQNVLESSIFYDFRYIAGEPKLVDQLRDHVYQIVKNNGLFFYHMANSISKWQINYTSEEVNIKRVMLPFISYIRLESLKHHINGTGTIERIDALAKKGIIQEERQKELTELFNFFMYLRLKHQALAIQKNDPPDNVIRTERLTQLELSTIKKLIKEIELIQKHLGMVNP